MSGDVVQRWDFAYGAPFSDEQAKDSRMPRPRADGKYVLAADHDAAVAAAREEVVSEALKVLDAYHPRCLEACELCAEWDDVRNGNRCSPQAQGW